MLQLQSAFGALALLAREGAADALVTPPLTDSFLAGVTRETWDVAGPQVLRVGSALPRDPNGVAIPANLKSLASLKTAMLIGTGLGASLALIILAAATTFLGFAVLTFLPLFTKSVFNADARTYSHLLAFSGAGSVVGARGNPAQPATRKPDSASTTRAVTTNASRSTIGLSWRKRGIEPAPEMIAPRAQ